MAWRAAFSQVELRSCVIESNAAWGHGGGAHVGVLIAHERLEQPRERAAAHDLGDRMQRGGPRFRNRDGSARWLMLQNSTTAAATLFPDGHFDWVYLDATHTYAEAKRDLEVWYPKVRVGGLVSGHDYQVAAHGSTSGAPYAETVRSSDDGPHPAR